MRNVEIKAEGSIQEWRDGWPAVLAGAAGMMMISCNLYSLGVFIGPLQNEFGWSRLEITAGHTVTALLALVLGPMIGLLVDRYGPRRVALPGVLIYCSALSALSLASTSIWSWWMLWGVVATATLVVSPAVWTTAVARCFFKSRGLALAVTLSGTGIGLAVAPNLATALIDQFGWRGAYVGLGISLCLVVWPVTFMFLRARQQAPSLDARPSALAALNPKGAPIVSWKEALFTVRFFKLATATLLFTICAVSFTVNLVPILISTGISARGAAAMGAIIGTGSIIGRISTGFLLDRFDGNTVGAASVLAPLFGCLLFVLVPGSPYAAMAGTFAIGLALGAEYDVMAYLVSRHFGTKIFATVFAMLNAMIGIGSGFGPVIFSHIYDATGSYMPALWISIPLYVIGAVALYFLGPYGEEGAETADLEAPPSSVRLADAPAT